MTVTAGLVFLIEPVLRRPGRALILLCLATLLSVPARCEDKVDLTAENVRWYSDQKITASGNVEAVYNDYKITSDSVEADLETNLAVFSGNVILTMNERVVTGGRLSFNLKTREWSLQEASTKIEPASFDNRIISPAFVHGEVSGEGENLKVESGTLTTCELDHPHYYFSAGKLEIYPGSRIVARKVSLFGLDKRLFTLGSLLIPIKNLPRNFIPQVGQSAEEGMFLKTAYTYAARENSQGFLKLDLMSNRGIGTGLEHSYRLANGNGQASLYYLADQELGGNNITGTFQHHQKVGSVDANFSANYRARSYLYYPGTTSRNWQLALNQRADTANTSLTFRGDNSKGYGNYETFNSSLRHTRQFGQNLNAVLSMDMRSYNSSSMAATDSELDSVLEIRQRADKYDLSLVASKRTDLDGSKYTGDDFYGGLDRLPEITLQTDSYRLGEKLFLGLPSRLSVSAGVYNERPAGTERGRVLFEWDMLGKTFELGRNDLDVNAGIRQAFYGEDMSQYVLKFGSRLTSRYGDYTKSTVSYQYQRPEGYSPFLFDYTGRYNYMRAQVDHQRSNKLRWSLATGYNFDSKDYEWQDLTFRLTAHPSETYGFSVATGYDLNQSKWRSLIGRFKIDLPERLSLDIGTTYDIDRGKISLARSRMAWHMNDKWRLEGISSWNGTAKKFDFNSFRLTRDLHCWEASLSYDNEVGFRTNRGLSFQLRIKALPFQDRFGIGQYGQEVDTSMGEYYY